MDLSLSDSELGFAREAREWLSANLGDVPRFADLAEEIEWGRHWQARMAADRWVGLYWPRSYGGRGASPVPVSYTHLTLPTNTNACRSRWWAYH